MPSKKNKTRVTRKKAVKTTARKPVKKATVSKVKKAKSKSSLVAVSAPASKPASTPTSPRPARPRLSAKKPEQTKVMPARKVGRAYTTKPVDENSAKTSTEVVERLKKNQLAGPQGLPTSEGPVSVSAKGPRAGQAAVAQNKTIRKPSHNTIHKSSGDIVESQTSEITTPLHTSLHKGAGDNTAGHARKPFKERRRLENDKKEYQQGALFMDEFETYQESDLEETAKNTGRRYTQRKADKHTMEASAKGQGNGQSSRRKNSEWRDTERSDNQQTPSQHSAQQQVHAQVAAGEREAAENMPIKENQHGQASGDVGQLQIKLSNSLFRKLIAKAEMEGVTVDEFAGELLAEGLVLRAWEIMERKSAMRTGHTGNGGNYGGQQNRQQNRYGFRNNNANNNNSNNGSNNNSNNYNRGRPQHGGNNSNHGNMSSGGGSNRGRMSYSNIMEDSANFLEYVRSQEKKQK